MACHLLGAKPLPEPTLICCQLYPFEWTQLNLNQDEIIFIQENAYATVICKKLTISFKPQYVKKRNDMSEKSIQTSLQSTGHKNHGRYGTNTTRTVKRMGTWMKQLINIGISYIIDMYSI